MRPAILFALCAALLGACAGEAATRPQWRVSISTNAPVPALADRMLVEVLDERGALACSQCARLFGLDDRTTWPLSFGIVPQGNERVLRARLFRSDHVGVDGGPTGTLLIDALGLLEPPSTLVDVSMRLSMDCFGQPADVGPTSLRACDLARGPNSTVEALSAQPPLETKSAAIAREVGCGEIPSGMVCVPGGVFLLGDRGWLGAGAPTSPERLVRLEPFAMDVDEMTVATARALLPKVNVGETPGLRGENVCAFTEAPDPSSDVMPLNCVSHALATALCAAAGKTLPTEAQWEYAAGDRGRERSTPWGDATSGCTDAIIGRGRSPLEGAVAGDSTACRLLPGGPTRPFGPVAGGSPADLTALGIKNLGGNLAEWVLGAPSPYDDRCFGAEGPLVDPKCPPSDERRLSRGGHWAITPMFATTTERGISTTGRRDSFTGLRCVFSYAR